MNDETVKDFTVLAICEPYVIKTKEGQVLTAPMYH